MSSYKVKLKCNFQIQVQDQLSPKKVKFRCQVKTSFFVMSSFLISSCNVGVEM